MTSAPAMFPSGVFTMVILLLPAARALACGAVRVGR